MKDITLKINAKEQEKYISRMAAGKEISRMGNQMGMASIIATKLTKLQKENGKMEK